MPQPSSARHRSRSSRPPRVTNDELQALLGHDGFRPGQREAIDSILAGRDTLAIMSTGAGKSAIYQVCGAMLDGPTLVVSPLIALQRDQVDSLEDERAGRPVQLASTLPASERRAVLDDVAAGEVEFVFLAPEQLQNEEALAAVRASPPSLVVIDEAHCVSTWGHDFRPAYAALGDVIDELGHPPVLCLTATASPPVRDDIIAAMHLRDPAVIIRGFDRPNISLATQRFLEQQERDRAVVTTAAELDGDGIVYVATRRRAEELAASLSEHRSAVHYHGAMKRSEREASQEAFVNGDAEVIVATNAFGMGIDKPDVRWVLHADLPDSLDSYYQEVGRAGRDGERATAILFYRQEDVGRRRAFTGGGSAADDPARAALMRSRLEMMRSYAESTHCRRGQVLAYFGEPYEPPCGNCDNCLAEHPFGAAEFESAAEAVLDDGADRFAVGTDVTHREWGRGSVLEVVGDRLTVLFDDVGYKQLSLGVVLEEELLEVAPPD